MSEHRINLSRMWRTSDQSELIDLPQMIESGGKIDRSFGKPSGIGPADQICLRIRGDRRSARIECNDRVLPSELDEWDLTELILPRNRLVIQSTTDAIRLEAVELVIRVLQ